MTFPTPGVLYEIIIQEVHMRYAGGSMLDDICRGVHTPAARLHFLNVMFIKVPCYRVVYIVQGNTIRYVMAIY